MHNTKANKTATSKYTTNAAIYHYDNSTLHLYVQYINCAT